MSKERFGFKIMSLSEHQREREMIWVKHVNEFAGFTPLAAESMRRTVLWAVTPCNLAEAYQLLRGTSSLHLRCQRVSQSRIQQKKNKLQVARRASFCVLH
jgi:hypothetical protein